MNSYYLNKLEYNKILEILSNFCTTFIGKRLCLELLPSNDKNKVKQMLQETSEATSILYKAGSAPIYDITDITIYLKLLESDGVLTAKALLDLANILKNANELKKYFMKISNILYDEIEYYNVDIDLNEEIDLVKYFKLAGIEFDNKHNNLIEKFIDILEIYSELYDQTMIFINVLTYFSNEEIREILKYITYKKISVLFLENSYNRSVYFENKYVIDDDFYDYIIHDDKS